MAEGDQLWHHKLSGGGGGGGGDKLRCAASIPGGLSMAAATGPGEPILGGLADTKPSYYLLKHNGTYTLTLQCTMYCIARMLFSLANYCSGPTRFYFSTVFQQSTESLL